VCRKFAAAFQEGFGVLAYLKLFCKIEDSRFYGIGAEMVMTHEDIIIKLSFSTTAFVSTPDQLPYYKAIFIAKEKFVPVNGLAFETRFALYCMRSAIYRVW